MNCCVLMVWLPKFQNHAVYISTVPDFCLQLIQIDCLFPPEVEVLPFLLVMIGAIIIAPANTDLTNKIGGDQPTAPFSRSVLRRATSSYQ